MNILHSKKINTTAFTMLELVVVVAIIAITATIATGSYSKHVNKSRVAAALGALNTLEIAAKAQYEELSSATNIKVGGVTFANNTVTALDLPPVVNGLYIYPGGHASVPAGSFLVCVYVGQLKFSGYVAPTPGSAGTNSRVCKQVKAGDHIYTNKCGSLQANSSDIPAAYLPEGCNCANIWGGTC